MPTNRNSLQQYQDALDEALENANSKESEREDDDRLGSDARDHSGSHHDAET
jgi:hypothetical protein